MPPPILQSIPLSALHSHPANPNVMPPERCATLRAHIARSGRYPPLIVRPRAAGFQILDGHWRRDALVAEGYTHADCLVWDVDDAEALLLLATLNRLAGEDNPGQRARLLAELAADASLAELAVWLPESEAELAASLDALTFDGDAVLAELEAQAAQEAAAAPQLFTFLVEPEAAPTVATAIALAEQRVPAGKNRSGRALAALAGWFVDAEAADGPH